MVRAYNLAGVCNSSEIAPGKVNFLWRIVGSISIAISLLTNPSQLLLESWKRFRGKQEAEFTEGVGNVLDMMADEEICDGHKRLSNQWRGDVWSSNTYVLPSQ